VSGEKKEKILKNIKVISILTILLASGYFLSN